MTSLVTINMFHSVQNVQWLRGSEEVQSEPPNNAGTSHFFISSTDIDASDAGSYFCRLEMTDGTFSDPVSVGHLTVLGQFSPVILPVCTVRPLVHTVLYKLCGVHGIHGW